MNDAGRIIFNAFGPGADHRDRAWQPFKKDIEMVPLYSQDQGPSAALLRYEAGARVPAHRHAGYEHIIVLEGSQSDNYAEYPAGTCLISRPGSEHAVMSAGGCVVLAIWQRPVVFL